MRILEIVPSLSSGGAERFVVDLSNELSKMNHHVTLCTLKDDTIDIDSFYKSEISQDVDYKCLKFKKLNLVTFFSVYRCVREVKPDIVHVHLASAFFSMILSLLLYRKCSYVITSHNKSSEEKKANKLMFYLKKWCYQLHLFKMVAISPDNSVSIKQEFGKDADIMIYNGRQKMRECNRAGVLNEISKLNKESNNPVVFVNIARCSEQKNHIRLVKAFNQLIEEGCNAILLIIGERFDSDLGEKIKKIAGRNIYFVGARHNVADYLSVSTFFCLSSDYEGMPITLIEALSCGCIPISTPVSGVVDIVDNGVTGFISADFTIQGYIATLHRAMSEYKSINRNHLKEIYQSRFSIFTCATCYERYFKKIRKHSYNE